MERVHPRRKLSARHRSRHLVVGENEVGLLAAREEIPSFAGRGGFDNASAKKTEFLGNIMTNEGFIFDDKNPHRR